MPTLYIVEQRKDALEVVEWLGSPAEALAERIAFTGTLTEAFRRARMMAGERPGLVLEEMPVVSQVPLVFLEARHG